MIPLPGNEAFVVLKVVDRAVGLIATDVRRQKIDDVVFTDGKSDIDLVPKGSVDIRPEDELAADDVLVGLAIGGWPGGHESETPGENLHAACLVDEVERTAFEGELLVHRLGVARQKYHRQGHAPLRPSRWHAPPPHLPKPP